MEISSVVPEPLDFGCCRFVIKYLDIFLLNDWFKKIDMFVYFFIYNIGTVANFTYALSVLMEPDDSMDFNTKLLGMFMLNQFIYSIFYVVMKMCKREWTFAFQRIYPLLYLLVALAFWIPGVYFFLQKAAKWEVYKQNSHSLTVTSTT